MENQFTNSDIAEILSTTGKLMDLHDVDPQRAKAYVDCVFTLERLDEQIAGMNPGKIAQIRGYGRIIQPAILEILQTGTLQELSHLMEITPKGIFDIMQVKGLGVKKVKTLWKEVGIDNLNALKKACEEDVIAGIKGFGAKTQESILSSIAFLESLKGKMRLDQALVLGQEILDKLKVSYPEVELSGELKRIENVISELTFIVKKDGFGGIKLSEGEFEQDLKNSSPSTWRGWFKGFEILLVVEKVSSNDWVNKKLLRSASPEHLKMQNKEGETFLSVLSSNRFESEEAAYSAMGCPYIIPEMRSSMILPSEDEIVEWKDITGALHNHSTYSDGEASVEAMAQACRDLGFVYFGIADHSQTAAYAKGLWPETVSKQHKEIDALNAKYNGQFRIFKGIESDILNDGSLDYEEEVLKSFDYIVASVHSVLNMDEEKATARLIRAIENPYTKILGHPTGRLLLRRTGYPIDYKKVIDACAANGVVMELNANPWRLDLDWTWIPYCLEKGVMISINPDAHSTQGLLDIKYGVMVARKAGLPRKMTLNALSVDEVAKVFGC
ncbi:PHP domain protein [Leadbetterella byssophila DSM 17132]|uniref:PHP domain protein n=1 Tax=Leadbetterella byssophila (strain DSM 17132 / JCM 16389 / KACC 11308 / NBRC 106382 / 4M15) TaxID=649349 RepID=E4RTK9_LEAB4|nr:DNA polymerase/3'-5' exonuclease PolX [Leadbetterella byssophila]ADQ16866.1 PHP domain protein [Leadbetterella byssophila DSM 17132]